MPILFKRRFGAGAAPAEPHSGEKILLPLHERPIFTSSLSFGAKYGISPSRRPPFSAPLLLALVAAVLILLFLILPVSLKNGISMALSDPNIPSLQSSLMRLRYNAEMAIELLDQQCPHDPTSVDDLVSIYVGDWKATTDAVEASAIASYDQVRAMHIDEVKCFHTAEIKKSIEKEVGKGDQFKWNLQGDTKWKYTNELLSYTSRTVAAKFGDGRNRVSGPILRKIRDDYSGGIVYRAGAWRHFPSNLWMIVYEDNIDWRDKEDVASWRGSTTGCTGCYPSALHEDFRDDERGSLDGTGSSRESVKNGGYASRAELVRRIPYFREINRKNRKNRNKARIDVGVTSYVQGVPQLWGTGSYMTKKAQMDGKMIIVAEGNDVATGSKWAMLSSSVVVTTKPSIYSWLMEDKLIANVHYLEVKWDWSDLEEKVMWCLDNLDECELIGKMGRCWMRRFLMEDRERLISKKVVEKAAQLQEDAGICHHSQ